MMPSHQEASRRLNDPRAKHHEKPHTDSGATKRVFRTIAPRGATELTHTATHTTPVAGRTPAPNSVTGRQVNIDFLDLTDLSSHKTAVHPGAHPRPQQPLPFLKLPIYFPDAAEYAKSHEGGKHTSRILVDSLVKLHADYTLSEPWLAKAYAFADSADNDEQIDSLWRYGPSGHYHCRKSRCKLDNSAHIAGELCPTRFKALSLYEEHMRSHHKGDYLYSCAGQNCDRRPHGFTRIVDLQEHLLVLDGKGRKRKTGTNKGKTGGTGEKGKKGTTGKTGAQ